MISNLKLPAPVQTIHHPVSEKYRVQLNVLRLDLIHSIIGGNKYFKLKYNLEQALQEGHNTLLTFGGAYSNHILATAVAGSMSGFKTIGIIRGEENAPLNSSLQIASGNGMKLHYISREQYRNKHNPSFIESLQKLYRRFYLIPEGGSNELGVIGCEEILQSVEEPFDVVCCACGTGATLAGIILSLKLNQTAIGFPVLKDGEFLNEEVKRFLPAGVTSNWSLQTQYHFGGYAKQTSELIQFISNFNQQTQIPLDRIYTGKLFFGVMDLIQQSFFPPNSKLLLLHTGGLLNGGLNQS